MRAPPQPAMRKRGEMVVRSFAHALDRGGMRRAWLRGRQNVDKRYLIHVAGFNLGIQNPAMFGQGTPREAASARAALLYVVYSDSTPAIAVILAIVGETAMLIITIALDTP
jgi:transposase